VHLCFTGITAVVFEKLLFLFPKVQLDDGYSSTSSHQVSQNWVLYTYYHLSSLKKQKNFQPLGVKYNVTIYISTMGILK